MNSELVNNQCVDPAVVCEFLEAFPVPKPICVVFDDTTYIHPRMPTVLVQVEPQMNKPSLKWYIRNHAQSYALIYTYDQECLDAFANTRKYAYGTSWNRREKWQQVDTSQKKFRFSGLAGSKFLNDSIGHRLRQLFYQHQSFFDQFQIPYTFFRSSRQLPHLPELGPHNPLLGDREDLFEKFQYSFVIENSIQTNYFTEKLVDCLLMKTIPIYWGCPNISEFFDTTGWIILNSYAANTDSLTEEMLNGLREEMSRLGPETYDLHRETIQTNVELAQQYIDFAQNVHHLGDYRRPHTQTR